MPSSARPRRRPPNRDPLYPLTRCRGCRRPRRCTRTNRPDGDRWCSHRPSRSRLRRVERARRRAPVRPVLAHPSRRSTIRVGRRQGGRRRPIRRPTRSRGSPHGLPAHVSMSGKGVMRIPNSRAVRRARHPAAHPPVASTGIPPAGPPNGWHSGKGNPTSTNPTSTVRPSTRSLRRPGRPSRYRCGFGSLPNGRRARRGRRSRRVVPLVPLARVRPIRMRPCRSGGAIADRTIPTIRGGTCPACPARGRSRRIAVT